jgi:hypothetical protein
VVLSGDYHALLQLAFGGSIPTELLIGALGRGQRTFSQAWCVSIAIARGMALVSLYVDPARRSSFRGMIDERDAGVIYGWARRAFFKAFTHIDKASGIPRPALWLSFGRDDWTLPLLLGTAD